jgi:hypothetical protein
MAPAIATFLFSSSASGSTTLHHRGNQVVRAATSHDRAIPVWERFRDASALRQLGDQDDFSFLASGFSPDIGRATRLIVCSKGKVTLMPRCIAGEERGASSLRRMAGGTYCERDPKGTPNVLAYTNNPETMTFNHCCFAIAPTTALSPRIQGVL